MDTRVPLVIMMSVTVFGGTVFGAVAPEPAAVPSASDTLVSASASSIADVRRGMTVQLTGRVSRIIDRDEFRLSDGTGSIPVRIAWSAASPVAVGDSVVVEGVITDQKTFGLSRPAVIGRMLRLPGGAIVRFDAPPPSRAAVATDAPAVGVVPIGELARGQSAKISGRVTGILDSDEFRVEDSSGSVRVYVGWQNRVGVKVGDEVTVDGTLDDEPWPMPAEFYAKAITLGDGRVVQLGGAAWSEPGEGRSAGAQAVPASDATPLERSRIADIRPYDTVLLRGTVERVTDEDEFRLRDDSAAVVVYIGWRNAMPVAAGEEVSVVGIVDAKGPAGLGREVYAHEITTADGRRIALQPRRETAGSTAAPASPADANVQERGETRADAAPTPAAKADAAVTSVRAVRRGQSVTLRGEVQRLRDSDEFVLRDDTGTITIYIGWRNRMPVSVGQIVTVVGTADDDVIPGRRPEIYASRIVLPDGRAVELIRGGRDE